MLDIQKIDHVGIRVREKARSIAFYQLLGFELRSHEGFERGHPIIMEHPCGVVLNLLGPATSEPGPNVLMDVESKAPGYTHMALRVPSVDEARAFFAAHDVEITGQFSFKGVRAIFVRDPDLNVVEFDEYAGDRPATRITHDHR